jgi:hypothetical protein
MKVIQLNKARKTLTLNKTFSNMQIRVMGPIVIMSGLTVLLLSTMALTLILTR